MIETPGFIDALKTLVNEAQNTIDALKALDFNEKDSNENLAAIAGAIVQPKCGWTVDACEELRDSLVGILEQLETDKWSDEYLEEVGLVRLPKDANGETIHVGDRVDCNGDTFEVRSIKMYVGEVSRSAYVLIGDQNAYTVGPDALTHHHETTVEDVLCEFTNALARWVEDSRNPGIDHLTWSEVALPFIEKIEGMQA